MHKAFIHGQNVYEFYKYFLTTIEQLKSKVSSLPNITKFFINFVAYGFFVVRNKSFVMLLGA